MEDALTVSGKPAACPVDQDCPYTIELIQPEDGEAVIAMLKTFFFKVSALPPIVHCIIIRGLLGRLVCIS